MGALCLKNNKDGSISLCLCFALIKLRIQKRGIYSLFVTIFVCLFFFRLSDYLFTAARYEAMKERRVEQIYVRPDKHEENFKKS